jgi:predicted MFS family arabinose efflux permease
MLTVFNDEPINYSIANGDKKAALALISKIYQDDAETVYEKMEASISKKEKDSTTLWEAMTAPEYRKATWICFFQAFFCHQYTGFNAVYIYSATMATKLNEEGNFPLTPTQTSYGLGICVFVSVIFAPNVIDKMSRRGNLLFGHAAMTVCMIAMGLLMLAEYFIFLYVVMCIFMVVFVVTEGTIVWLYYNEVSVDAASGLLVFGMFGALIVQTMTLESMMNSSMGPIGVFFFYGGCNILGGLYCWLLIKETAGLTDK